MKQFITIITVLLLALLNFSCKDEVIQTDVVITAATNKSNYNPGELITVNVKNFTHKTIYINQCGEKLHPSLVRIDSSSSGGGSFTMVCRQLTSYALKPGESVSDTLSFLLTGRYKLKYLYDFENIMPELCREELYSNEFDIK
ncbi:MAG: hypothetical protein R6W68_05010 [Ignavibacteriaceae bacterium]